MRCRALGVASPCEKAASRVQANAARGAAESSLARKGNSFGARGGAESVSSWLCLGQRSQRLRGQTGLVSAHRPLRQRHSLSQSSCNVPH